MPNQVTLQVLINLRIKIRLLQMMTNRERPQRLMKQTQERRILTLRRKQQKALEIARQLEQEIIQRMGAKTLLRALKTKEQTQEKILRRIRMK